MRIAFPVDGWSLMHPWDRILRQSPGEGLVAESPLEVRLFDREGDESELRAMPGASLTVRQVRVVRPYRMARPEPNAPLLKRLVRYPFQLHAASGRRGSYRKGIPWEALVREPTLAAAMSARAAMGSIVNGNPVRHLRPSLRARHTRPSAEAWLAGRPRDEGAS